MFSTFILDLPRFSGAGSSSVGHKLSLSVLEQLWADFLVSPQNFLQGSHLVFRSGFDCSVLMQILTI